MGRFLAALLGGTAIVGCLIDFRDGKLERISTGWREEGAQ
jgi:hypothetical protein